MTERKPWYTSKTVWAGAAGLISAILVFFNVDSTGVEIGAVTNGLAAIGAIIFRVVSKKELTL